MLIRSIDDNKSVCVVVLTWNDIQMTENCIKSVLNSNYDVLRIILVDNGSKGFCGEIIKQRIPEIELIKLPYNKGFTGGSNAGLIRAIELKPDYIFFLNNDTIVDTFAISNLVDTMEQNLEFGMASALLLYPNEKRVQFYRALIDRDCARHTHIDVNLPLHSRDWPLAESEFVPACAVLLRTKALIDVGLFDETFGTSWEDFDLCIRFIDTGWKIVTVGSAFVEHHSHKTTGSISPYMTYYSTRNRLICIRRYSSFSGIIKSLPLILRTYYWQINEFGLSNWECHKSFIRAFFDFFIGRRGEERKIRNRSD